MEVVICAIARKENRYVREWVNYHLSIGFSHIYLYDNNREGEERLDEVLTNINNVTIIPYHDVVCWPQIKAYEDCWMRFKFDWCLFIDLDEFFTFGNQWGGEENMESFVKSIKEAEVVLLNWMTYGDNGNTEYENRPVVERFPKPLPLNFSISNMFGKQPVNGHVKSLVKHTADFSAAGPHVGRGIFKCCNADGESVENKAWQKNQTYKTAYLRHYITKSISEYFDCKLGRGLADQKPDVVNKMSYFFLYNKPTIKKLLFFYRMKRKCHNEEKISLIWWLKQIIKYYFITPLFVK